jgi:hypothetical protein
VAMGDARHMAEYGVARISVARSSKEYIERKMYPAEVAAVQAWIENKDGDRAQLPQEQAAIHDAELSITAQAAHNHEALDERLFDMEERFKQNMTDVLQPGFPDAASDAEKLAFLQDQVEAANKEKRRIRVELNLAKCGKAALASSGGAQPEMEEEKAALRGALEAYDLKLQSTKRKREVEKADDRERQKAATMAVRAEKTVARAAAKEIVAIAAVSAAPAAPVVPAVAKAKAKGRARAKTGAQGKAKGKAKAGGDAVFDAPMFDTPVRQANLDTMFKGGASASGVPSLAALEAEVAQDEREEAAQGERAETTSESSWSSGSMSSTPAWRRNQRRVMCVG